MKVLQITSRACLIGCASPRIFTDLTAYSKVSGGVCPGLDSLGGKPLIEWGAFGTSSIWVAYPYRLPDTVHVSWREGSIADHDHLLVIPPLLPPINPAKQKYHMQFWFYPGDSVDVKVDVLDIGDCDHIRGAGKTRTPQHGPCSVMNDW